RETEQFGRIWIVGERRRHDRKELPEKKDSPERNGEEFRSALGHKKPRHDDPHGESAEAADSENGGNDDAGSQFRLASASAQPVDEHTPAEFSDGGKLGADGGRFHLEFHSCTGTQTGHRLPTRS